ncbi:MAG: 16S rRNA (guanine(527)-N(7))-methyltransferase RsmG [Rubricella sp.]
MSRMLAAVLGQSDVSRETRERFDIHLALLRKWQRKINLVSASTLDEAESRHIADSAALWRFAPQGVRRWLDLGSGAGFPGLVIAAIAAEKAPGLTVTLIESDLRKAAFLSTVIREAELPAQIIASRIEDVPPQSADVISARALAPLSKLLAYAERHRAPGSVCLFHKGARHESELTAALESWNITHEALHHPGGGDSVILKIEGFDRVRTA